EFSTQVDCHQRKSRRVAARVGQTFDEAETDRVRYNDEYDGNGVGDLFKLDRTKCSYSDNYIGLLIDQFSRQCPEAIRIFRRKAMVQMNVLAFDIAEIVERFP